MVSKQNHQLAEANSPGGLQDGQAGDREPPRPSVNNDKKSKLSSVVKNSQMEDGKSTFPVFGLLAQPTPSNLLLAQITWQKFPVSPLL